MAKRQASASERRITRSSGVSDIPQELPAKKKRKIELENDIQETPTGSRVAQNAEAFSKTEVRLPTRLSDHLTSHFWVQKQTVLRAFKESSLMEFNSSSETKASEQLKELIDGTVSRQEGNSCLILGPRGSGKNKVSRTPHDTSRCPNISVACGEQSFVVQGYGSSSHYYTTFGTFSTNRSSGYA